MIICFDFDGTLTNVRLQELAIKFKRNRDEVWVVTMRRDDDFNWKIMKPVLDKIGISKLNVCFCNNKPKLETLSNLNADIYIDNISNEFEALKEYTSTVPLLC